MISALVSAGLDGGYLVTRDWRKCTGRQATGNCPHPR